MPAPYSGCLTILDASGNLAEGARVFTYAAGTSTPKTVYTTAALSVPHGNPIVTSGGRTTFFLAGGGYRIEVRDADGAVLPQYSVDNVTADQSSNAASHSVDQFTATDGQDNFPLSANYAPGADSAQVFINGLRMRLTDDFLEPNGALITTTFPCRAGWEVDVELNSTI